MDVTQALQARHSVRAFLPDAVDAATVRMLLEGAARAASGGNLQPWRVVALAGPALAAALDAVARAEGQDPGGAGASYPPNLWEPYRTRRFANGEDLYRSIGIPREDKPARLAQLSRNAVFFGAPVGIFVCVDERMGLAQWLDLGAYLQSLMLLAVEHGLGTCAQGFWRRYGSTLAAHLALPGPYRVAFGVALGREDTEAPVNAMRASRAPFAEWGELRGF
ncbi:nitroreductase [Xylophilus sp.]|uniref:nitroreductase n=1 Tax=Xylophilus sp. TaxID=2653893 RepID=UPI0013BB166B|nr:nitroreductase [Xylophilus sp.]KAF1049580.1 MAG: Nitrobenzene nitroreductase [Xylophilus sp.]